MENAIARLAQARLVVTERKAVLAEAEAGLHQTSEWEHARWAREYLQLAKGRQEEAESILRKQALAIYEETGDKAPHPAVPIKMYTVLEYEDTDAFDYALEHLPGALKLVKRAFEKVAKVLELDFVIITKEPRASIARDLSEYIDLTIAEGDRDA